MAAEAVQTQKRNTNDYDALLERALDLEEWHSIKFDHLSAIYKRKEKELTIYCEIRPLIGLKLKHNISIIVVIYDTNDRIVNREHILVRKEEFYSFEVGEITFYDLTPKKMAAIEKIKIYPTKW